MTEGKLEAGHAAPSLAYQPLIGNELKEQESIGWITVQHKMRYNLATEHIIQTANVIVLEVGQYRKSDKFRRTIYYLLRQYNHSRSLIYLP
jgi:hypothetical protein